MSRKTVDTFQAGLVADVQRIRGLLGENKHEEAFQAAQEALAKVVAHGARSAQVLWLVAVSADYSGHPVQALEFALAAVEADPGSPEFDHSLDVVVGKARQWLAGDNCEWETPVPAQLYELLQENGLTDDASTVAYAVKHLHAQGRTNHALRMLESVVTLNPGCSEAWKALQAVAKAAGRDDLAEEAELQSLARDVREPARFGKVRALA